jgi:hypothetical protein
MPTTSRTVVLVGDRFAGFAVHEDVFTVSQFLDELLLGTYGGVGEPILVQAGQGVTIAEWSTVCDEATRLGLDSRLDFRFSAPAVASRGEVHKRIATNTLVADLRQQSVNGFTAALRLHGDNELLLDHQTGQHVQGMVVVEAARQMFLAVSERFYANRYPDRSYYFVIESMNTDFENFLFPLPATIEFSTVRAEISDPARLSFDAEIHVHQAGRRASRTTVSYTAFESELIEAKEYRRARHALDHSVRTADVPTTDKVLVSL